MADRVEPKPAQLPLPGGQEGAVVRLHPLLCGEATWPDAWPHRRGGPLTKLRALGFRESRNDWVPIPLMAFLVEHPGFGPFLIDTGLDPSVAEDPRENLGRLVSATGAKTVEMKPEQAVPAQLRERRVDPNDVGLVVMTHLHYDHASGVSQFPRATFLVTGREWEAAHGRAAVTKGYRAGHVDHPFNWHAIDFDERGVSSLSTFGRAFDLFGDGSVHLLSTPGHTRGHMSVLLHTGAGDVLAVGDAAYTRRTLRTGHLPAFMDDEHLFRRSLREIQLFSEQRPDAVLIPGHDMGAWRTLEPVYG